MEPPPQSKEICKHYRKGACRYGFSGKKQCEEGNQCQWNLPKICSKLFKYGFHPERGCKGKKSGCTDFHPFICGDLLKGECLDPECKKGFHLKSLKRRVKRAPDGSQATGSSPVITPVIPVAPTSQEGQNIPISGGYSEAVSGPPPKLAVSLFF